MADSIKAPAGYTLDVPTVAPPAGYTLDQAPGTPAAAEPKSVTGFLSNAASSAGRFASDVAGAVVHPGRTVEGLTGLFEGMAEKSGFKPVAGVSHEQNVDALMKMYGDRYGSIEKFKNSLYTDPVGIMADIATLGSGVGAAGKGVELAADAAKFTRVADVAGTVAKGADAVSSVTDPLRLAGKAAGKVADVTGLTGLVDKGTAAVSKALTRGALRGGTRAIGNTKDSGKIAELVGENENAVSEMNARSLPLSEKGQAEISAALNDLQQQKHQLTGSRPVTIDPAVVELELDKAASMRGTQANPQPDLKQIEQVRHNFREATGGQPMLDPATGKQLKDRYGNKMFEQGPPMPADEAEALKEGTYRNNKYGADAPPQLVATAEAEKSIARGLKNELEVQIPELADLNANQKKLLDLDGVLARAVAKRNEAGGFFGNLAKQTLSKEGGLKLGGLGAAGYYSGHPEAAAALAAAQAVLSDPAVKQRLAMGINLARKANPGKYGAALGTGLSRVNEYASSLQPE